MLTKQEKLKQRIRILKKMAKDIAWAQVEVGPLSERYYSMAQDGRRNKSEKFLFLKRAKESCKKIIFQRNHEAREIYKEFWLIGISCVDAGRFFQNLVSYHYEVFHAKK